MTKELFSTIMVCVFGGLLFFISFYYIYLEVMEHCKNEKDAIRKYELYGNRLFETVVYVHEITDFAYGHFYKAVLYEIVGKKKIVRDRIEVEKKDLVPLAEKMLLEYLTEETKEEIEQKTFEALLDNYRKK
jgi:hypothetical protein